MEKFGNENLSNEGNERKIALARKTSSGLGKKLLMTGAALLGMESVMANDLPKESTPVKPAKKIETNAKQEIQTKKTISWEEAQKIQEEIAQLKSTQSQAEQADKTLDKTIEGLHSYLDRFIKNLPRNDQYADMYSHVESYLINAAKKYDLTQDSGRKQFVQDMIVKKDVLNASKVREQDPELAKELTMFGQDYNSANFGVNDLGVRTKYTETEEQFLLQKVNDIIAEKYVDETGKQIALNTDKLKNVEDQKNMASLK